ncbi:MAG TPA: phage tail tube protein, partial [Acidimicrobiales bacterium]|nr:phage tail tube protein [Acidimicrobiales bacterium]
MGEPLNGKEVLLLVEDVEDGGQYLVVGRQRNVTFNRETAEVDASSKDDEEIAAALPGRSTETVE